MDQRHGRRFPACQTSFGNHDPVQPLNPNLDTILMTDAWRLFGIGFALLQPQPKEKWSLIQCDSASLTPTQTIFATIELECMAIQWAIRKCVYYLSGLPTFQVWTDHKPLVGIFQESICGDLHNPRLMRMREKIMECTQEVKWVPGKTHYIADALSRSPLFDTNDDDYLMQLPECRNSLGQHQRGSKNRKICSSNWRHPARPLRRQYQPI